MGAGIAGARLRRGMPTVMIDVDAGSPGQGRRQHHQGHAVAHRDRPDDARRDAGRCSALAQHIAEPRPSSPTAMSSSKRSSRTRRSRRSFTAICRTSCRRRDPGVEHLDDLDHAHGPGGGEAGEFRRHALLQSGRSHAAGRGDPRREDQRRDRRDAGRPGQEARQDADRGQATAPAFSSIASCSRT